MIRTPIIFWLLPMIAANAADLPDLLRFTNDDPLRGTFRGMREGPQVLWKNEDLAEPAAFKTSRIQHIVLRGGKPLRLPGTLSHADFHHQPDHGQDRSFTGARRDDRIQCLKLTHG